MATAPKTPVIVWFRRDLRLADNPALAAAIARKRPLILLFIREPASAKERPLGAASNWWLDKSLRRLSEDIRERGGQFLLRSGDPKTEIRKIISETGAQEIYWNRRYDLVGRMRDTEIKSELADLDIKVESFNGSLLSEPWAFKTGAGGYYKVFTPYWRRLRASYEAPHAHPTPKKLNTLELNGDQIDDWALHPESPDWSTGFNAHWRPGEQGAHDRLTTFVETSISQYQDHRNRPDIETGTSGLSAHLAFGEIGPAQIWRTVMHHIQSGTAEETNAMVFLSQIAWRDFSYVLLFHNPDLATVNYNQNFDFMPWRNDDAAYQAWRRGQTGYPMVDAGMRQLWQTGWMHNRVRMIVASFLTKHLLLHWTRGEDWFWDTLIDADPAANAASWQWTAGSGADAAPYFRVFNPITQGPKFDVSGDFVRKYCPELSKLPTKYIHRPWEAPPLVLLEAGVTLGDTYPVPIIEHKQGRERALAAYNELKRLKDAAEN